MSRQKLMHTATCTTCAELYVEGGKRVQAFPTEAERDDWADKHIHQTGHNVTNGTEWREPDPAPQATSVEASPASSNEPAPNVEPEPETVDAGTVRLHLVLGGPLHGQHRSLPENLKGFRDPNTGQGYKRLGFIHGQQHPLAPSQMVDTVQRDAFVHESAQNIQQAMNWLADIVLADWIRGSNPEIPAPPTLPERGFGNIEQEGPDT